MIVCMIGTLGTKSWVKLDLDHEIYGPDFASYEGGLDRVTRFHDNDVDIIYDEADDYYCDQNQEDNYNAWCEMFKGLWGAAGVYVLFEIISIACLVCWGIILIAFIYSINCFPCTFFCSVCAWVAHFIAIFGWIAGAHATFDKDCNEVANDGDKAPKLCVGDGPALSIFIVLVLPIIVTTFIPLGCIALRNKKREERLEEPSQAREQDFQPYMPNNGIQMAPPGVVTGYPVHMQPGQPYGFQPQGMPGNYAPAGFQAQGSPQAGFQVHGSPQTGFPVSASPQAGQPVQSPIPNAGNYPSLPSSQLYPTTKSVD